ncbi:uncharacterized protein Pyn_27556 [Prunus yedoensis var. nudiflora]|uniref:Uncharacterized protein n=1 Tax=Prunus yedoensis var. nudiflora TaxID=2094558 RepID=A0A314YVU2_PRUYE|nr:uncharacterized protein Pyn_27556 [Prunus yedoensis var. nudiflora]
MKIEKESSASDNQKLLDSQKGGVQQSNSQEGGVQQSNSQECEVNGKVAEVPNSRIWKRGEEPLADTTLHIGNFAMLILLMLNEAIFSFYNLLAEIALLFFKSFGLGWGWGWGLEISRLVLGFSHGGEERRNRNEGFWLVGLSE